MGEIEVTGLPKEVVREIRRTRKDSNGQTLEVQQSNGNGNPCRHCLQMIEEGEEHFVLAHRPFSKLQPYAETGPIFLHVKECSPYEDNRDIPESFTNKETIMLRGYDSRERIVYGTGKIVPMEQFRQHAAELLSLEGVEFVHVRSACNNCYQARIDRV